MSTGNLRKVSKEATKEERRIKLRRRMKLRKRKKNKGK
jgi:hypothetical protein